MKKILLGLLLMFMFAGCSVLSTKPADKLMGKEYVLVNSSDEVKISLNFAEENFFGFSGVNNYFGKYKVEGNKLNISHIGSTLMAGPKQLMDMEYNYISKLDKVEKYKIEGKKLILTTNDGNNLVFIEFAK